MTSNQLPRTLEPEYMDDPIEASLYDSMDHQAVNAKFVDDLIAAGSFGNDIIDLGSGTARIPILLAKKVPGTRVMAIDAATHMLDLAVRNVDIAGLLDRIQPLHADIKSLEEYEDQICDLVISNTLLHHLPEPIVAVRQAIRLVRTGGRIFIRDLMRPKSAAIVESLVDTHASLEPESSKQLLRQSLHAALTLGEAQQMAVECGFEPDVVTATSDRHWTMDAVKV